jgi:AraC-like DNA-binding protein
MQVSYREIPPPPTLDPFVECFWVREIAENSWDTILPDGCADIVFSTRRAELVDAVVAGVMTRPHLVRLSAGESILGIRFHPGMAGACLPCDLSGLNDRFVAVRSVLGSASDGLVGAVRGRATVERKAEILGERLADCLPAITTVQRAIGELVGRQGRLSAGEMAAAARLGERQLRRTCLKQSGLAPKPLARVLRFRHAVMRLHRGEQDLAELALDCGYYDQAHMNRDFRILAGMSPARFRRPPTEGRFVQDPALQPR